MAFRTAPHRWELVEHSTLTKALHKQWRRPETSRIPVIHFGRAKNTGIFRLTTSGHLALNVGVTGSAKVLGRKANFWGGLPGGSFEKNVDSGVGNLVGAGAELFGDS